MFVDGNLNSKKYTNMLSLHLVPLVDNCYGGEGDEAIFQEDNAPADSLRYKNEWFMDNDITVLYGPAKTLDLNVVENAWGALLRERYTTSPDNFITLMT